LPVTFLIADGHDRQYSGITTLLYKDPLFVFAKAVNMGIKALLTKDVILVNDDCQVIQPDFFRKLATYAAFHPDIGILSSLIRGKVGNDLQRWTPKTRECLFEYENAIGICFPCVFLRRKMINQIGLLNEGFVDYGGEDTEYCTRARAAGWRTAVVTNLVIQHGDDASPLSPSFNKRWWRRGKPTDQEIELYFMRNKL
jgi:GT2 family glycosyltransferase